MKADITTFLTSLAQRRKILKMPLDILSKRSGLSRATVCRLLKGDSNASFAKVVALAEALGVRIEFKATDPEDLVEQEVERHARKVVRMVQGTMGLESQAVEKECEERMLKKTRQELLGRPRKELWYA